MSGQPLPKLLVTLVTNITLETKCVVDVTGIEDPLILQEAFLATVRVQTRWFTLSVTEATRSSGNMILRREIHTSHFPRRQWNGCLSAATP